LIDEVHNKVDVELPDYICVTEYYNVCAQSLITPLSWSILNKYHRVWRHNNETVASYNACPAIMEDAMDIIEPEISRIKIQLKKEAEQNQATRGNR